MIAKLDALEVKAMSPEERINLAIYRERIEVRMGRIQLREYEQPPNADTTFWGSVAGTTPQGLHCEAQARSRIALLNDVLRFFADETTNMPLAEREITTKVDPYISWLGQALSYYLGEMKIVAGRGRA